MEFYPPREGRTLEDTTKIMDELVRSHSPDYMTVTYKPFGKTCQHSFQLAEYVMHKLKILAVSHLTCVGHTKDHIDALADTLDEHGIHNILALRGDPPPGAKSFEPDPNGFSCARDLIAHLSARNFTLAATCYPEKHPEAPSLQADVLYLKEKVDAGAQVLLSQLFFNPDAYYDLLAMSKAKGIAAPIVPGIMPIRSKAQLIKISTSFGISLPASVLTAMNKHGDNEKDMLDYGTEFTVKFADSLLKNGAPGIHFYTFNNASQIAEIVQAINLRRRLETSV